MSLLEKLRTKTVKGITPLLGAATIMAYSSACGPDDPPTIAGTAKYCIEKVTKLDNSTIYQIKAKVDVHVKDDDSIKEVGILNDDSKKFKKSPCSKEFDYKKEIKNWLTDSTDLSVYAKDSMDQVTKLTFEKVPCNQL